MAGKSKKYRTSNLLKDAWRSYRGGRCDDAERILENVLDTRPDDPYPYFLQAVICLHLNRFSGTHNMLNRIELIDDTYMPAIELRAFMKMKAAANRQQGVSLYVEEVSRHPGSSRLQKALKKVRGAKDFSLLQKEARLKDFVSLPKPPRKIRDDLRDQKRRTAQRRYSGYATSRKRRGGSQLPAALKYSLVTLISAGFLTGTGFGGWFLYKKYFAPAPGREVHSETVDAVNLTGSDYRLINKVNRKRTPEFYASAGAVKTDFNRARRLIKKGRYNEAALILNRISNSNATFSVREKCDFLIRFIMDVDYRSYEKIAPGKIKKKPWLYRGFGLSFSGKVTNLKTKPGSTGFTLLLNYRKVDIFDGIAHVFLKGQNPLLENGAMVTVKGLFTGPLGSDHALSLTAREITAMK